KKREIKELEVAVKALESKLAEAEARSKQIQAAIAEAESVIAGLSKEGHQEELSFVKMEKDLRQLEETTARHTERALVVARELEQIGEERRDIDGELGRSAAAIAELEAQKNDHEVQIAAFQNEILVERARAKELRERVTALKVAVAARAERRDSG